MSTMCMQDLSVYLQTVNVLPWELEGRVAESLALLDQVAADLRQGWSTSHVICQGSCS